MRHYFLIDAIDPLIMSEHSATAGNHQSLDFIPGSAIFGAIASKLYNTLSAASSWDVFHSGGLRIGNFYPVKNNELGYPMPFAWHEPKVKLAASKIFNLTEITRGDTGGVQLKQKRSGYLNKSGYVFTVRKGNSTKTALNSKTGIADEGRLFNYQFIHSSQQFLGWVECKDSEVFEQIRTVLKQGLRIGRSRNNEFGRVKVHEIQVQQSKQIKNTGKTLTLWCVSDACLLNVCGQPSVHVALDTLFSNLQFQLNETHSFVRIRRASFFNQKRQGYDSEMLLVEKGSVYRFELSRELTNDELQELQLTGIGIKTELGLGQVVVNPSWATEKHIKLESTAELYKGVSIATTPLSKEESCQQKSTPLLRWVSSVASSAVSQESAQQEADVLFGKLVTSYSNMHRYNNTPTSHLIGPSRSQWGRVRSAVTEAESLNALKLKLFGNSQALCEPKNDEQGWGAKLPVAMKEMTFARWFEQNVIQPLSEQSYRTTLFRLIEEVSKQDLSARSELEQATKRIGLQLDVKGGSK